MGVIHPFWGQIGCTSYDCCRFETHLLGFNFNVARPLKGWVSIQFFTAHVYLTSLKKDPICKGFFLKEVCPEHANRKRVKKEV